MADWNISTLDLLLTDSTIQCYIDGSITSAGIGASIAEPRTKLYKTMKIKFGDNYRNQRIAIISDNKMTLFYT